MTPKLPKILNQKQIQKNINKIRKQQKKDIEIDLIELSKKFYSLDLEQQQNTLNAVNILLDNFRDA